MVRPDPGLKPASQLFVFFAGARGPWPRAPWSLQVRCDLPGRRDAIPENFARVLRRMHAPERVDSTYKKIRRLAMRGRSPALPALSRNVPGRMRGSFLWVNPGPNRRDREDLIAQIALFLSHANLLRQSGRDQIEGWLLWYLGKRFKLEDVEASQTRRELRRYVRPPSATSWTAYVRLCIPWIPARRAARREHPHENGSPSGTVAGNGSAGEAGADPDHSKAETGPDKRIRPAKLRPTIGSELPDRFTVDAAAKALGISRATLYSWINKKKVSTGTAEVGRRMYITGAEIERVESLCPRSPKAAIEARKQTTGSSNEAARKWVWRNRRASVPLETLVDDLRAQDGRPRLVKGSRKSTDS